jgi:ABC-2 type transport system permease protein
MLLHPRQSHYSRNGGRWDLGAIAFGIHASIYTTTPLLLTALLLTVASYVVAWRLSSTQGFHAVINLLLVPAWMLSGAIFNPALSFAWVRGLMQFNPLYYSQSLVRTFLVDGGAAGGPSVGLAVAVLAGCTLLAAGAAVRGTK